ncbi:60S ribosomal protein L17-2 [Tanacetum coccineum]|uniref:60S ribosomal protein L17-2 n=1 Tax=Tanacetum coccineum TaxID=301880 RepID=A0ABQ4ZUY5_9ASTR
MLYAGCAFLFKVKRYLKDVLAHKQAISFTRLCRGVGRTSWTIKESTFKWTWTLPNMYAKFILDFSRMPISTLRLKDVDALHISHILVNQTQKQRRRTSRAHGRINRCIALYSQS